MIAIELKNVTKTFKDLTAVNDLSVKINRGEYVALLGPNGAGKTTLVEMIEGIQIPDKGEIQILGKVWKNSEQELKNKLGFSLQETHFIPKLTVEETVKLFSSFYTKTDRASEILDITGLGQKRETYVENLSGGQRQKLALSIALIHDPEILILDEPTTGLDPTARREIWNILQRLKSRSTTLILTTHYMEEAEYLCDRILIMNQGKFIAQGSLESLLEEYQLGEIIEFSLTGNKKEFSLKKISGIKEFEWNQETGQGKLIVHDIVKTMPILLDKIKKEKFRLEKFECRKMTLDDLFLSMTGRRLDA
ncbi:MAG: ABC transporter ATP-binding protein [Leptospiraceae bacterium]|nr:ABC transporter ATP-binding protein [Leptospiraceae bacterium]